MQANHILKPVLLAFVVGSLGYLVISESGNKKTEDASEPPPEEVSAEISAGGDTTDPVEKPGRRVIAYYFHGNVRCPTCLAIEDSARQALGDSFPDEIASGTLEWRAVNTDEVWNAHFLTDFNLSFSSLVIAEVSGTETVNWKNLDKVWELVRDQGTFFDYVRSETRTLLETL